MGKEYHDSRKNHEGYADPTAYEAIRNVDGSRKKRGRPKNPDGRKNQFRVRITDEERQLLEEISQKTGKSYSDIFRNGLKIQHDVVF